MINHFPPHLNRYFFIPHLLVFPSWASAMTVLKSQSFNSSNRPTLGAAEDEAKGGILVGSRMGSLNRFHLYNYI